MPTCPKGHESADAEFCDICGLAMAQTSSVEASETPSPVEESAKLCPACDAPLEGRFCEVCGHDSLAPPPPRAPAPPPPEPEPEPEPEAEAAAAGWAPQRPKIWTATVSADRAYYDKVMAEGGPDADSITFPPYCPDRYFPLRGTQVSIGRRSVSRGINPDIDLTGPPEDSGVSHLHGVLIAQPDGGWAVVDLGSSNGTVVNDSAASLRPNTPHPLRDGDHFHLGAWTRITINSE